MFYKDMWKYPKKKLPLLSQPVGNMNNAKINLTKFRKEFSIPADFIRSTCKVLNIEILKVGNDLTIPLYNQNGNNENDIILLCAFAENKLTGRIEKTKNKEYDGAVLEETDNMVEKKRNDYILIEDDAETMVLSKPYKDALDIQSSSNLDIKKEDFIATIAEIVSQSVANQNKSILNTQEELHNAMEKKWLLTNEQLASLLGMSKSTIGSKPNGWKRMGFQYTKEKEGRMTLWRVSQY